MAFSYSTGNPANLFEAHSASMADIKNSFTDISTYLNGSNITAASFSTAYVTPYTTIVSSPAQDFLSDFGATGGNNTYFLNGFNYHSISGATHADPIFIISFDPADYALTGKTLRLRLRVSQTNNADMTTAGGSLTFGLYPVTVSSSGGNWTVTMGTVVSGSTVATNITSSATVTNDSSDFAAPSAGAYVFGVQLVPPAFGGNGAMGINYKLQAHWI